MITLLDRLTPDAANIVSAGCEETVDHSRAENDDDNLSLRQYLTTNNNNPPLVISRMLEYTIQYDTKVGQVLCILKLLNTVLIINVLG